MAFFAAVLLVHQVHLQIALVGLATEIVLAHQAVEGDGRGGTRIGLQVEHLGLLGQKRAQLVQRGRGVFQRRACGHFHHHLELALVVKRQHLHDDPLHQRQADRQHQGHHNTAQQEPAFAGAVQEWGQHAGEQGLKFWPQSFGLTVRRLRVGMGLHQLEREPGCDGEGNRQRQCHAQTGVDWNRAHVRAHQTRHKSHRQQGGDDSQGGQDGGTAHFINRAGNDVFQAGLGGELLVAVNVFDHHDGVVHQNANRKNEREQGHAVQRKAPGPGGKQGGAQGQDHGSAHNHRFALAQGKADQQDDRAGGKGQFLNQLIGFFGRRFTIVARDGGFDVRGNHRVAQDFHTLAHRPRHVHRVFTRFFGDGDRHRRVDTTRLHRSTWCCLVTRCCSSRLGGRTAGRKPHVALRQLCTGFNPRHFTQVHRQALGDPHHQVAHILCGVQKLTGFNAQHLRRLTIICGRVQHRPGRHREIGGGQGLFERKHIHPALTQAHRVQPHMHGTAWAADGAHLAAAGHAFKLALHRVRHALQL